MNQVGYYGKTPHRGDFVRFNLPQVFINVWDDWLQQVIARGEQSQNNWAKLYSQAPNYRFVLSSGIAGNCVWMGLLRPSQDKVGRQFPFCLATSLPELDLPCVSAITMHQWFTDAEAILEGVYTLDYNFDELQNNLAALSERHAQPATPSPKSGVNRASDTLAVIFPAGNAFMQPLALSALLDNVLKQTLGEYSLWLAQGNSASMTLINSGLPQENTGVALFTTHWQNTSATHINLNTLAQPMNSADMGLANIAEPSIASQDSALETPLDANAALVLDNDQVALTPSTTENSSMTEPAKPALLNRSNNNRQRSAEQLPFEQLTDSNHSEPPTQAPSADDWAALEDFQNDTDTLDNLIEPNVEPLVLDDDDDQHAPPWEN